MALYNPLETEKKKDLDWWDYLAIPFEGIANIFGRSFYSPEEQQTPLVKGVQQWHPISGLWGGMESSFEAGGALITAPIRKREDWTTAIKPWEYLPGGAEVESYEQQIPWWQQMVYENAPLLLTGGAGAVRALPKAGQTLAMQRGAFGLKAAVPQAVQKRYVGVIEEATNPILRKLGRMMSSHKLAGASTKRVRKFTLGQRVAKAQSIYDDVLKKTGDPDLAAKESMSALKGELPTVKVGALEESLTPEELLGVKMTIASNKELKYFQKLNAQRALDKFLKTDELLQPAEIKLLNKIFGGESFAQLNILKSKMGNKAWNLFLDAANIPRSVLASTDLSFTLRQGAMLISRFPKEIKGTLEWQLKTLFSQENWRYLDDIIRSDPDFGFIDGVMKVYFAPEPGALAKLTAREEMFMSSIAEKIPFVKVSERAFTAGGNYLRYKAAKNYLAIARKAGMDNDATLRGLGKLINAATGRGEIPRWLGEGAPVVNAFLFAPRFVWSRIQTPTLLFSSSPLVRKEAARLLVQFMGAGTSVISLAVLAGAKVELDPRSSDFGKIWVGNTRLDVWAGYVQWARFLSQAAMAESKISGTGATWEFGRGEIALPFSSQARTREKQRIDTVFTLIQSKESPVASIFTDLLKGENFLGEPLLTWEDIRSRITPLFVQDLWDAIETDSVGGGLTALPGLLGVGVVSYEGRKPSFPEGGLPELPGLELPKLP